MDDNLISTNVSYSSMILSMDLLKLRRLYPFLEFGSIGRSVLGKNIPYVRIGRGSKHVFYSASFHANEWITTPILMKFLADFCYTYVNNQNIYGYSARALYDLASIYIVPMVNPDGVDLVTGAISPNSVVYNNAKSIALNYPDIPFVNGWKANIRGVGLSNFQHTLLINRHIRRFLCTNLFLKFLHILLFHYLLIDYHLLYLSD